MRQFSHDSPIGMLLIDEETMIVDANSALASMVSRSLGQIINQRGGGGLGCIHSTETEKGCGFATACAQCPLRQGVTQVLKDGTSIRGAEIQATLLIDGQEVRPWLRVSAEPVVVDGRRHVIAAVEDVTERKQSEEKLVDNERRYRLLWESASDGFCLHELIMGEDGTAVNYRILDVNPVYERVIGVKASEIVGKLATEAYGTIEPPYLNVYAKVALTGVSEHFETTFRRMGRQMSISVFSPSPGQFATAFSDISERKTHEQVLAHQASHDVLTGLPNRHYFEQHLSGLIQSRADKRSQSMTVLFLDLDKFKLINDTLGHKSGDLLLVEVADRLRSCLRSEDVLARMGGDEFTIILSRSHRRATVESVASRMIDIISRPFDIQGHKFVIGASIGLASYPSDGTDTVALLKHADAAMYKAKQSGRGTFCWYSGDVDVENQQRADMEMDIRAALEKGQFKLY